MCADYDRLCADRALCIQAYNDDGFACACPADYISNDPYTTACTGEIQRAAWRGPRAHSVMEGSDKPQTSSTEHAMRAPLMQY